jgi:hypothetical protein
MLAYYLTWQLREAWAPVLFKDEHPPVADDPVAKAARSPAAQQKAQTKRTASGEPCHSYLSLIAEPPPPRATRSGCPVPTPPSTSSPNPHNCRPRALEPAANAPVTA